MPTILKRLAAALLLLSVCPSVMAVSASGTQSPQVSLAQAPLNPYDLRALPWANLFYQIDCLAGKGHCSESSYRELWQALGWGTSDEARLKDWQALRTRYYRQIQFESPPDKLPLPTKFDGVVFWDKIRAASFNAKNRQELAQNLAAVMQPADAEALMGLLEGFETRFFNWWAQTGQSLSDGGAQSFAQLLAKPELPRLLEQASRFYQAELSPQSVLGFNFMARPALGGKNHNGEQVDNQSVVEVLEQADATSHQDVTIHELSHYFYRRISSDKERQLMEHFAEAGTPEAIAAYNLLNEVMATSIGNGLFNQMRMPPERFSSYLSTPSSFFNDPLIDPAAKAVYLRVEKALSQGETLTDAGFVRDYLALCHKALGPRLSSPIPLLRIMAAAYEGADLAAVLSQLQRRLRIGRTWSANALDEQAQGSFKNFAALSGVLLVKPSQLERLKVWTDVLGPVDTLISQAKAKGSMIYGIRRSSNAWVFVLVAPEAKDFAPLIERLALAESLFEGALP
jgi:hypothetical protein